MNGVCAVALVRDGPTMTAPSSDVLTVVYYYRAIIVFSNMNYLRDWRSNNNYYN
jgi:hypothetical protein